MEGAAAAHRVVMRVAIAWRELQGGTQSVTGGKAEQAAGGTIEDRVGAHGQALLVLARLARGWRAAGGAACGGGSFSGPGS